MPFRRHKSNQMARRGTPLIGTRHFGIRSVTGRKRVPLPAANRNAFKLLPFDSIPV